MVDVADTFLELDASPRGWIPEARARQNRSLSKSNASTMVRCPSTVATIDMRLSNKRLYVQYVIPALAG